MDPSQWSSFDPNSLAYGGPGSTPLPGSHLQLQSSGPLEQQSLQSNFGFNNVFDHVSSTAFDQLLQDLNPKKRTSADHFANDTNLQLYKKQILEGQQPGSMQAMLDNSLANMPSIPSYTTWPNQAPSTCAPVLPNCSLGSSQAANHPVLNSIFLNQSNLTHVSPYGSEKYQQVPGLQQNLVVTENQHDVLQSRPQAAQQTIDLLKEKCSRYEKALLQYTTPDLRTGKLPLQLMKDEITTLRRLCSYRENECKALKAKCEDYSKKFYSLATLYNKLVQQVQNRNGTASSHTPTPPTPAASNTSDSITPAAASAAAPVACPTVQPVIQPANQLVSQSTNTPVAAKRANLIDLTIDDDSSSSATTDSSNGLPTAQPCNPFTTFRRNLNQKDMKWLRPTHPSDAVHDIYKQLNSRDKQGGIEYGYGDCYNIVQTQQHVRQALGGPFNQPPAEPRVRSLVMPGPCKPTTPPEKKSAEVAKEESVEESSMTDEELEELGRMMEEELARGCDEQANSANDMMEEPTKPIGDGLDYLFEEDPVKPTGYGLDDLFEEAVEDTGDLAFVPCGDGLYEELPGSEPMMTNEELSELLNREWPDLK